MHCPICHTQSKKLYNITHFDPSFQIDVCENCGLQMQNPTPKNTQKLYSKDYYSGKAEYSYQDERKSELASSYVWKARLKNIIRYKKPPASFLDVGCAFGGLVKTAQSLGYQAQGIDISPYACQYAKAQGLKVDQGSLEKNNIAANSFDVVTLVEVWEHLSNLHQAMQSLQKITKPKAMILVQTANFLGWQARLAKDKYHYYLPGHLFYYSTKNLRLLFSYYGFGNFIFFRGVDFGLLPKLQKSAKSFQNILDYKSWLRIAFYHYLSRIAYKDFAISSSMVMYAFKL